MSSFQDALARVIDNIVTPHAREGDETGVYQAEFLAPLGQTGILVLTSATAVGGGGQRMRAAAPVVEALAGRCGAAAMVVLMPFAATARVEGDGPESVRKGIAAGNHLATRAFSKVDLLDAQ